MLLILSIQELNKFSEIVTGQILITTVKRIVYKMDQGNNKANSDIFMRKLSFLGFGVSLISNCLIRALDLIHCIKKKSWRTFFTFIFIDFTSWIHKDFNWFVTVMIALDSILRLCLFEFIFHQSVVCRYFLININ